MQSNDPMNAAIKSSNEIFKSPSPKSMWNTQKTPLPIKAPAIPMIRLSHRPKPSLESVTIRPAHDPASAPMINNTTKFPRVRPNKSHHPFRGNSDDAVHTMLAKITAKNERPQPFNVFLSNRITSEVVNQGMMIRFGPGARGIYRWLSEATPPDIV